jgi:ferrous iron transport protein B
MAAEINPDTGEKVFNFASGISFVAFLCLALQCAAAH